jgi:glycine cleavage system H protein
VELDGCLVPDDRLYDLEHEVWWKADPDGREGLVGVLAPFAAFAGVFQSVRFRPRDGPQGRGRSLATVESYRLTGAVRLPLDGTVLEQNEALVARPRLLNDEPYDGGWVARVRRADGGPLPGGLEPAAAVASRLVETIRARRVRCWPRTPDVELNEVGLECSAVLVRLNEELGRRAVGDAVLLVTDDPTSPIEMVRWSDQTGYPVLAHRRDDALHQFLVRKIDSPQPRRRG